MNAVFYKEFIRFLWFTKYQIYISIGGKETFILTTWSTRKYGEMIRVLQLLGCEAGN